MAENQRQITLGTTYYNNPPHLEDFVDRNIDYVDELIIVDDGSPIPASEIIQPRSKLKLYRVTKDYGFNSHGCRNLIMNQSTNDWVVLMDADRRFDDPMFTFDIIRTKRLDVSTRYCFEAYSMHDYKDIHVSVNDFLVHRDHFFSVGGYDEELIGVRSGDRQFFEQLLQHGNESVIHGVLMKLTRGSSVILGNNATSPNDRQMTSSMERLLYNRIRCPDPKKPTLTFDWERVF